MPWCDRSADVARAGESVSGRSPPRTRRSRPISGGGQVGVVRSHALDRRAAGRLAFVPSKEPNMKTRVGSSGWPMTAALLLLGATPLSAGAFRVSELADGAPITPAKARFFASPLPAALHRCRRCVHRLRVFHFVPGSPPEPLLASSSRQAAGRIWTRRCAIGTVDDAVLAAPGPRRRAAEWLLVVFDSLMAISIVLGVAAIRRGEIARHPADDARLRPRDWSRHAGTDPRIRRGRLRPAGSAQPSGPDGRSLGDQPRRGRVGHPRAVGPCSRQRMEAAYRAQSFVLYRECGDDVLGAIS